MVDAAYDYHVKPVLIRTISVITQYRLSGESIQAWAVSEKLFFSCLATVRLCINFCTKFDANCLIFC